MLRNFSTIVAAALLAIAVSFSSSAIALAITDHQKLAIDQSMREWLAQTGAPSVSIAVVSNGQLAYAKAYGLARIHPVIRATATIRRVRSLRHDALESSAVRRI